MMVLVCAAMSVLRRLKFRQPWTQFGEGMRKMVIRKTSWTSSSASLDTLMNACHHQRMIGSISSGLHRDKVQRFIGAFAKFRRKHVVLSGDPLQPLPLEFQFLP